MDIPMRMIDPGGAAQPQDIPSIPKKPFVKLKQKYFLLMAI
jgi:hypothetical protein